MAVPFDETNFFANVKVVDQTDFLAPPTLTDATNPKGGASVTLHIAFRHRAKPGVVDANE